MKKLELSGHESKKISSNFESTICFMKRVLIFLFGLIVSYSLEAQKNDIDDIDASAINDSIRAEGFRLYRSEMASWYGTDIFLDNYKGRQKIGGYLSYLVDRSTARCIFFSKAPNPVVIGSITFDTSYSINTAKKDFTEREFTKEEKELFVIRMKALELINSGDTLFKQYQNTNLNLIPIISNGEKKVYILTGSTKNGEMVIGNDYLIRFTKDNELGPYKRLHKSMILLDYAKKGDGGSIAEVTIHTHLPESGDFMTATDVCSLLLYSRFTNWKQHYMISKGYVSIWDYKTNSLFSLTKEAWDRIYGDSKARNEKQDQK